MAMNSPSVLTLAGIPFTVTQTGIACSPVLSPTSQAVSAYGASASVTISQAAAECYRNPSCDGY